MDLLERLPPVRGRYSREYPLGEMVWFGVGGPAQVLFKPKDLEDLRAFRRDCPKDIPVTVVGVGSNLLVRDGGIPGVVVKLGRGFTDIMLEDQRIHAGAGALDRNVALVAARGGLSGFEFFVGIPGTIGGAVMMNGGAYGAETKDILKECELMDDEGHLHRWDVEQMGFSYRQASVPNGWIVVGATFEGQIAERNVIEARMAEIMAIREEAQPVRSRTGGSTFRNPEGRRAWELIDEAGCRGLRRGGALVSTKHCNFLINEGTASAQDLETLGEEVRETVYKKSGILLEWEIKRIGEGKTDG